LSSQWIGKCEIVAIGKVNTDIKKSLKLQEVHTNSLKAFYLQHC